MGNLKLCVMDAQFWRLKWKTNDIGFHQPRANPLLVEHFEKLALRPGNRVFLPLCGKTLDIGWFLSQGCRVAGVELSEIAIQQLFEELRLKPQISKSGGMNRYRAANIDIFGGDLFGLTRKMLGPVDAVYDRAALVALPPKMRRKYSAHLMTITNRARQLLIGYTYDQSVMDGPPFSLSNEEVNQLYGENFNLSLVASVGVPNGLKGKAEARENVWLLGRDF